MRAYRRGRLAVVAAAALVAVAVIDALPAQATTNTVTCHGTGDFCGASIALPRRGISNEQVTVNLTDTDFSLVNARVSPADSKGSFDVSHARFSEGGSLYEFTVSAAAGQPRDARIILFFAVSDGATVTHSF
jgi:hypothetical protein